MGSDPNPCMNACVAGMCTPATPVFACCGNGFTECGYDRFGNFFCEQCDDGNTVDADFASDFCDSNCTFPYCGNGIVDRFLGEQCDDGNTVDGDGCDSNCALSCGNGTVDAGEQCDDGNVVNGDGCSADCRFESLIPGGGLSGDDCAMEWLTTAAPPLNGVARPKNRLECRDGDPTCDFGAAGDDACTFRIAVCFNVPDARLGCTPTDIRQVEVTKPGIDPATPADTVNRDAIDRALQGIGATVKGVCINVRPPVHDCTANADCDSAPGAGNGRCRSTAAFAPPLSGQNVCTDLVFLQVPLRANGRERAVTTLRFKTQTSPRHRSDTDTLRLVCRSSPERGKDAAQDRRGE